jgi:hypothetical protein
MNLTNLDSLLVQDLNLTIPWSSFFNNTTSLKISELYAKVTLTPPEHLQYSDKNLSAEDLDIQISEKPQNFWQKKFSEFFSHLEMEIQKFTLDLVLEGKLIKIDIEGFKIKNSLTISKTQKGSVPKTITIAQIKISLGDDLFYTTKNFKLLLNKDLSQFSIDSLELNIYDSFTDYCQAWSILINTCYQLESKNSLQNPSKNIQFSGNLPTPTLKSHKNCPKTDFSHREPKIVIFSIKKISLGISKRSAVSWCYDQNYEICMEELIGSCKSNLTEVSARSEYIFQFDRIKFSNRVNQTRYEWALIESLKSDHEFSDFASKKDTESKITMTVDCKNADTKFSSNKSSYSFQIMFNKFVLKWMMRTDWLFNFSELCQYYYWGSFDQFYKIFNFPNLETKNKNFFKDKIRSIESSLEYSLSDTPKDGNFEDKGVCSTN